MEKNKKNTKILGNIGEEEALRYLMKKGHKLVDRNYKRLRGEIDLITENNNVLHFTEVKTVSRITLDSINNEEYLPEENLNEFKLKHFLNTIEYYLFEKEIFNICLQVNLVTIRVLKKGDYKIDFYQNINL